MNQATKLSPPPPSQQTLFLYCPHTLKKLSKLPSLQSKRVSEERLLFHQQQLNQKEVRSPSCWNKPLKTLKIWLLFQSFIALREHSFFVNINLTMQYRCGGHWSPLFFMIFFLNLLKMFAILMHKIYQVIIIYRIQITSRRTK